MFCWETTTVNLNSITLLYTNADKWAEHKFHFIMTIIKKASEDENKDEDDDDELITYGEYLTALKSIPELHKSMLPWTLTLKEILEQKYEEEKFKVSDMQIDDFVMFRYEMNTIFKKT